MQLNLLKVKLTKKFLMPIANDGVMVILSSLQELEKQLVNLLSEKDNFEISIFIPQDNQDLTKLLIKITFLLMKVNLKTYS